MCKITEIFPQLMPSGPKKYFSQKLAQYFAVGEKKRNFAGHYYAAAYHRLT